MNRKKFLNSLTAMSLVSNADALPLNRVLSQLETNESTPEMPVLFIGHGNPMNAIEENTFTKKWAETALHLPKPSAILCISAHWLTRGTYVTAMQKPKTIHDFGGFPQALFDVQYPAQGLPTLATEAQHILPNLQLDHDWGLDHGAWSVLVKMYPKADVPVLQLSIDYYQPPQFHYDLGKKLAQLRKKGVLIIGSGNMVHNLSMVRWGGESNFGFDWALEMNAFFKKHIKTQNHQPLIEFRQQGRAAQLAIPTPDHYYPLLYVLGMQSKSEPVSIFNDAAMMGSLTMTSVKIGG